MFINVIKCYKYIQIILFKGPIEQTKASITAHLANLGLGYNMGSSQNLKFIKQNSSFFLTSLFKKMHSYGLTMESLDTTFKCFALNIM